MPVVLSDELRERLLSALYAEQLGIKTPEQREILREMVSEIKSLPVVDGGTGKLVPSEEDDVMPPERVG